MSANKLDKDLLNLLGFETMKEGQVVEGIVTETVEAKANFVASSPINVQVSAFIRAQLLFSDVLSVDDLASASGSVPQLLAKKYKVNQKISLTFQDGKFKPTDCIKNTFQKGDLAVVRFVKSIGFGVTV